MLRQQRNVHPRQAWSVDGSIGGGGEKSGRDSSLDVVTFKTSKERYGVWGADCGRRVCARVRDVREA